jgi:tetratricopeptide (TPR) repeat protein
VRGRGGFGAWLHGNGPAFLLPLLLLLLPPLLDPRAAQAGVREEMARADSLWSAGRRDTSVVLTQKLIDQVRQDGDSASLVDLLTRSGTHSRFFGKVTEAEPTLREAVRIAEQMGDSARVMKAFRWLSAVVGMQGRSAEAQGLLRRYLALATAQKDPQQLGWAWVGLSWHAVREGRTEEGIDGYRRAAKSFAGTNDVEGRIYVLLGLSNAYTSQGQLSMAVDCLNEAAGLAQQAKMLMSEAMVMNDLGTLEFYLGDPGEALRKFERSRAIHRQLGSVRETVTPLVNIALCLRDMDRFDAAEDTLANALDLCRTHRWKDLETVVLTHSALLNAQRGLPHEAARRYRQILRLTDPLALKQRINCLDGLAEAMSAVDSQAVAVSLLNEALDLLSNGSESQLTARVRGHLGQAYRALGRPREACRQFQEATAVSVRLKQDALSIAAMIEEAETHRTLGRPESAQGAFLRAAALWEAARAVPVDPTWREGRGTSGHRLYTGLALSILDSTRAGPDEAKVEEAFDRLQAYKARTLLERMLRPGERFDGQAAGARRMPATLATLRVIRAEVLRPGELLLDVYLGPDASLLFAVTRETQRCVRLPGEEDLKTRLVSYSQLLSDPPSRRGEAPDLEPVERAGALLAETLCGGIDDLLEANDTVILAGDGVANLLSLASLLTDRNQHWFRVPSATVLMQLRRRPPPAGEDPARVIALASAGSDSLPRLEGSLREVRELGRQFRKVRVRTAYSDHDSVPEMLRGPDVLHIASHLFLDDHNPWNSEIRIFPAGSRRNLSAATVCDLGLNARLAVLSSCSSAGGRVISGEGVIGVSGAFLSAGVPAVVATLWPVDDQTTATLMGLFYDELARGETVTAALGRAQNAVRGLAGTSAPFYWAGFVVVGDGNTIVPVRPRSRWDRGWPLAVLVPPLALAGFLFYRRTRLGKPPALHV